MFNLNKLVKVIELSKGGFSLSQKTGKYFSDYVYDEKQPAQDLADLHNSKYYYLKAARLQWALMERVCESEEGSVTVTHFEDTNDCYSCLIGLDTTNTGKVRLYDSPSVEVND